MRFSTSLFISCLLLGGCKVGPNYTIPDAPTPTSFQEDQPSKTAHISDEELTNWWKTFQDPFLESLLQIALEQNFDYKIALENIVQARAQYSIQCAQILPELDMTGSATRYRTSKSFKSATPAATTSTVTAPGGATTTTSTTAASTSPLNNLYQVGLDAIWEIDLFGKLRRSADASFYLWEATIEEMRGVKITLISEVITTYATICASQKQKSIAEQMLKLDEELLLLAQMRFDAGLANQQEIESTITTLEADIAALTVIKTTLQQSIYSMAQLLGKLPEEVVTAFELVRPIPRSAGKIPIGLPSTLLRRRPDIRSAEKQLASATEQIGVAMADLFPTLALTGSSGATATNLLQGANVGFSSDKAKKLFRHASSIWGIGGVTSIPIFDFGKRKDAVEAQEAIRNQAYYAYQKSVLAAFQETEQALVAYFNEELREQSLYTEAQANERNVKLTLDLFEAGLIDYSQVIAVKDTWLASLQNLTSSQLTLTSDLIAIYKALGGDWQ